MTTQTNPPVATVAVALANFRSGPGTNFNIIAQVARGTVLGVTGRNPASDWLQLCCVGNAVGWIWRDLLVVEGSLENVPVIGPPPPPPVIRGWRGEYFANRDLQGAPAVVRDDPKIAFRWGGASPAPGVPGTNFSVRWTRVVDFQPGDYTFFAQVDDGVRLYLDGWLVIDEWRDTSLTTYQNTFHDVGLGPHTVTVEYYQAAGDSVAVIWWEPAGPFLEWKGEYYDNANLQLPPVLVRNDVQLNFDWGMGSPDPAVPANYWSARWTRRVYFEAGNYNFFSRTADGARVYLDGWLVIDQWREAEGDVTYKGRFQNVGTGEHLVTVEYFNGEGAAYAYAWWEKV